MSPCFHVVSLQACADKLKREIREFGYPPVFPIPKEEEEESGRQDKQQLPKDPASRPKKVHAHVYVCVYLYAVCGKISLEKISIIC